MSNYSQKAVSMKGLFLNTEQRAPCVLMLDISGSMEGPKIAALNRGLATFLAAVKSDALAAKRVELAIVTFGDKVTPIQAFATVDQVSVPVLSAEGETPMGAAIVEAFRLVKERQDLYYQARMPSYAPWYVLITDGEPTDDLSAAKKLIDAAEKSAKGAFYAIGVEGADMETLRALSVRPVLELDGVVFNDLFLWLSASLGVHSRSPTNAKSPELPTKQLGKKKGSGR